MPITKIKERYQVTIPKEVRRESNCQIGDSLEVVYRDGRIVMIPKQTISELSTKEQQLLKISREKLEKIGSDHVNSTGLTKDEIRVAVKVGLIDPDEAWWYTEEWQEGEREATRNEAEGRISEPLEGESLLNYLDNIRQNA